MGQQNLVMQRGSSLEIAAVAARARRRNEGITNGGSSDGLHKFCGKCGVVKLHRRIEGVGPGHLRRRALECACGHLAIRLGFFSRPWAEERVVIVLRGQNGWGPRHHFLTC